MDAADATVVVTSYNYGHFLPRALDSLAGQTVPPAVVIVDDGSDDDTPQVAAEFADAHPELDVSVLRQRNGGLGRARNRGIALATTPFIACLDADDWFEPDAVELLSDALRQSPSDAVARPSVVAHFESTGEHEVWTWPSQPFSFENLVKRNIAPYCAMFRRDVWEEVGGYDERMPSYEDWNFWISIAAAGHTMTEVEQPLLNYRVSETGMFARAKQNDAVLRATIVTNHPDVYGPSAVSAARRILSGEPVTGEPPHPIFDQAWWPRNA